MAKRAIQKMKRGPDGRQKSVYLDLDTAEEIPLDELDEYEIITAGGFMEEEVTPAKPTEEDKEKKLPRENLQSRGSDPGYFDARDEVINTRNRDVTNNFGYKNKPRGLGLVSLAPGMIGMAGKAVNTGWNISNLDAVNKARQYIGLEPLGLKDTLKGVIKDNKGQVADVKINNQDYSVGFNALSPQGRTNLTPDEARKRSLANATNIEEIETRGKVKGTKSGNIVENITGLSKGWAGRAVEALFNGKEDIVDVPTEDEPVSREIKLADAKPLAHPGQDRIDFARPLAHPGQTREESKFADLTKAIPSPAPRQVEVVKPNNLENLASSADKRLNASLTTSQLHPAFKENAQGFVDAAKEKFGVDINIASTYRDADEQNDLYALGRTKPGSIVTKAKGGSSMHNYGLGMDLVFADLQNTPNWSPDDPRWTELGSLAQEYGLKWGGVNDMPHVQVPGVTIGELKNAPRDVRGYPLLNPDDSLRARGNFVPTPTPAPRNDGIAKNTLDPVGQTLDPLQTNSVFGDLAKSADTYAQSLVQTSLKDIAEASPARLASMGYIDRTPAQIDRIAFALAGELSPTQLAALEAGDLTAKAELANMVTTIENRAAAKSWGTFDSVLDPGQYNSMMAGKLDVTKGNYGIYKDVLASNIANFYKGGLTPTNYNLTNYHAPYSDPSWSSVMDARGPVGDHIFGILGPAQGDYKYNTTGAFNDLRNDIYSAEALRQSGPSPSSPAGGSLAAAGFSRSSSGPDPSSPAGGALAAAGYGDYSRGYDRSGSDAYADRSSRGTFGTSSSPGVGRSSLGGGSGGGGAAGSFGGGSRSGPSPSSPAGGSQAAGGWSDGSRSSSSGTSRSSAPSAGGYTGSPTSDGYGGSKTPGGGF